MTNTVSLHHRTIGSGPPLVVLHGLFGSSDNWQTLAKAWSGMFQVILPDLRNHGRSPWHPTFDYNSMAFDVLDLCNHLGLSNAYFLGHSMGGKVAMQVAMLQPSLVSRLMVVDIAPKAYPVHHDRILDGLLLAFNTSLENRAHAESLLTNYIVESDTRQFLLKSLYRTESGTLAWRINIPVIDAQLESIGREITYQEPFVGPVLFVRGEHSQYILDTDTDRITRQFPQATLQTIANAGHWVHADQPQQLDQLVTNFFAS